MKKNKLGGGVGFNWRRTEKKRLDSPLHVCIYLISEAQVGGLARCRWLGEMLRVHWPTVVEV